MCRTIFLNIHSKFRYQKRRSSRSQMFFKIDLLKNFAIFKGNHLCWSLFRPATLLKRDSNTGVFLSIWLFYRAPLVAASENEFAYRPNHQSRKISMIELSCKNSEHLKAVNYFYKKAPF